MRSLTGGGLPSGCRHVRSDVQMLPPSTTAAIFMPSLLKLIPRHCCGEPVDVSLHDTPESVDVQMLSP